MKPENMLKPLTDKCKDNKCGHKKCHCGHCSQYHIASKAIRSEGTRDRVKLLMYSACLMGEKAERERIIKVIRNHFDPDADDQNDSVIAAIEADTNTKKCDICKTEYEQGELCQCYGGGKDRRSEV